MTNATDLANPPCVTRDSDIYFKQVLFGPMQNFIYFIGSKRKKQCLVVDPAWDTQGIVDLAAADDMRITGMLITHYHPDHVGGGMGGFKVPGGVADLLGMVDAKVHVNKLEADGMKVVTGISDSDMVRHDGGDKIEIGDVEIQLIHTPGHTPGSQCFLVHDSLVAGDTLFVSGCGRVDLPGSDPEAMRESLHMLGQLPDEVVLYPGHDYGPKPTSTMKEQRMLNFSLMDCLD